MKIGIIGFGNLGKALLEGIIHKNITGGNDIYVCVSNTGSADSAREKYGVNAFCGLQPLYGCDLIFITLKKEVFRKLYFKGFENTKIVSCMSGVSSAELSQKFGASCSVTRIMPSLGVKTASGLIPCCGVEEKSVLPFLGELIRVGEDNIEVFTAAYSCGLGFLAFVADAFYEAASAFGTGPENALKITDSLIRELGSGDYKTLFRAVSVKGGATEAGLAALAEIGPMFEKAFKAAYEKTGN